MVRMSPSGMDAIKATLTKFWWAVSWEILEHVSSGPEHLLFTRWCAGIASPCLELSKNISCSTSASHFVVNFFQCSTASLPGFMAMWPSTSNTVLQSVFYFECVWGGGWVGGAGLTSFYCFWAIMRNAHCRVTWSLHSCLHIHPKMAVEKKTFIHLTFLPLFSGSSSCLI